MSIDVVDQCVGVLGITKNNRRYGMTFSQAMQCGSNHIMLCLGSESTTLQELAPGDIVGISMLSAEQKDLALALGHPSRHSAEIDKFENVMLVAPPEGAESVILVADAKRYSECIVLGISGNNITADLHYVFLEVVSTMENDEVTAHWLMLSDCCI